MKIIITDIDAADAHPLNLVGLVGTLVDEPVDWEDGWYALRIIPDLLCFKLLSPEGVFYGSDIAFYRCKYMNIPEGDEG